MKLTAEFIELLMGRALEAAKKAAEIGEVPVGAVIAVNGEIIAEAHNEVESRRDATAHAEILAMRAASKQIENWRLKDTVMCVTLEPCTMCIGALRLARVPAIIFGASDSRQGAVGSLFDLSIDDRMGVPPRIVRGVQESACKKLLSNFFEERRVSGASLNRVLH